MGSLNKVQLIGNMGADPEGRYLPSGDQVVNFSIATTDKWKDKQSGEQKEKTEWHRVSFFGRAAEVILEYCRKGSQIYVEGSLETRQYEKDGITRYSADIKGRNFQLLGGRGDGGERQDDRPAADTASKPQDGSGKQDRFDDDIPF